MQKHVQKYVQKNMQKTPAKFGLHQTGLHKPLITQLLRRKIVHEILLTQFFLDQTAIEAKPVSMSRSFITVLCNQKMCTSFCACFFMGFSRVF